MDLPEPSDLDTVLETGAWAWNWMEPPLGTLSFTLLCLQWGTEQRRKLGDVDIFSNSDWLEALRSSTADRVVAAFPQYNPAIMRAYGKSIASKNDKSAIDDDHETMLELLATKQ